MKKGKTKFLLFLYPRRLLTYEKLVKAEGYGKCKTKFLLFSYPRRLRCPFGEIGKWKLGVGNFGARWWAGHPACRLSGTRKNWGHLRRRINIFNFRKHSAGCFRETTKDLEKTIRHLEKTTKHLEKTKSDLVNPENCPFLPKSGVKTMEKAPAARLSPFLQCKYTTFFSEKQIGLSAF